MIVKLYMNEDVRRISVEDDITFLDFAKQAAALFRVSSIPVQFKFVDEDGDLCTLSRDEELHEAIHHAKELPKPLLRVHVLESTLEESSTFVLDSLTNATNNQSAVESSQSSQGPSISNTKTESESDPESSNSEFGFTSQEELENIIQVAAQEVQDSHFKMEPEQDEEPTPSAPQLPQEEQEMTINMDIKLEDILANLCQGGESLEEVIANVHENPEMMTEVMNQAMDKFSTLGAQFGINAQEILSQVQNNPEMLSMFGTGPLFEYQPSQQQSSTSASASASSSAGEEIHYRVSCNGCGANPITGIRYKCNECHDYDLCETCEGNQVSTQSHSVNHSMLKMRKSQFGNPNEQFAKAQVVHQGITCDACGVGPIVGTRYNCKECHDFDLCESCESAGVEPLNHRNTHLMLRMNQPAQRRGWGGHHRGGWGGHGRCGGSSAHPFASFMQQQQDTGNFAQEMFSQWCQKRKQSNGNSCGGNGNANNNANRTGHSARFVEDVTIEDGMELEPGTAFTKIWRMHNARNEPWPQNTRLVFASGDETLMSCALSEVVVDSAQPKSDIDIAMDFVAPSVPGRYRATYRLVAPDGSRFGHRIWVDIKVNESKFEDHEHDQVVEEINEQFVVLDHTDQQAPIQDQVEDFEFAEQLQHLIEMGFADVELNKTLLLEHNGALDQVLPSLLTQSFSF